MKKGSVLFLSAMIALCVTVPAMAQKNTSAGTAKGLCTNGLTGIITTPSARIAWESADIGLDVHYTFMQTPATHVPSATISFFKMAEVAIASEISNSEWTNLFINGKFQVYKSGGAALAVGANTEFYFPGGETSNAMNSASAFFIATYSGSFFNMPAVTSMLLGWQFLELDRYASNFNFSMGFEMTLLPSTFKNYVFWITDFGNYSYVLAPASGINAGSRGCFNTGLRFDILKKGNMKLQIDVVGTDLLDEDRGILGSLVFGIGF